MKTMFKGALTVAAATVVASATILATGTNDTNASDATADTQKDVAGTAQQIAGNAADSVMSTVAKGDAVIAAAGAMLDKAVEGKATTEVVEGATQDISSTVQKVAGNVETGTKNVAESAADSVMSTVAKGEKVIAAAAAMMDKPVEGKIAETTPAQVSTDASQENIAGSYPPPPPGPFSDGTNSGKAPVTVAETPAAPEQPVASMKAPVAPTAENVEMKAPEAPKAEASTLEKPVVAEMVAPEAPKVEVVAPEKPAVAAMTAPVNPSMDTKAPEAPKVEAQAPVVAPAQPATAQASAAEKGHFPDAVEVPKNDEKAATGHHTAASHQAMMPHMNQHQPATNQQQAPQQQMMMPQMMPPQGMMMPPMPTMNGQRMMMVPVYPNMNMMGGRPMYAYPYGYQMPFGNKPQGNVNKGQNQQPKPNAEQQQAPAPTQPSGK